MKFDTDQRSLAKTLNKAELSARFGSDKLQGVTHRPRIGTAECGASGKMQDGGTICSHRKLLGLMGEF